MKAQRIAYFDLANGVSGDMILSCLVHAGRRLKVPVEEAITRAIDGLPIDANVSFVDDDRGGLACVRAEVKTDGSRYTAAQLRSAIGAVQLAQRALDVLVEAEAAVHGVDPADVHLHELSSTDTAVDLVGAAAGFEALGVNRVSAAAVPVPSGWIAGEHGALPLPAPATLEILRGATLNGVQATTELVTPSGAAILVAHDATFGPLPELVLETVGTGAGTRPTKEGERPNICRMLVGTAATSPAATETCIVLESNIDDQTPEQIAHAIEGLLAQGALDAWVTPIVMKKSRPAFQLSVLARPCDESSLTESFFRLTTTLGIRRRSTTRSVLDREEVIVDVDGHSVRVKVGRLDSDVVNVAPEFDDCAAVADATGLALQDVFARATELARRAIAPRA